MTDRGGEFSFFWGIHVRNDIRIVFSISLRHITTRFGKQVHLKELTQMRGADDVITSRSCDFDVISHF